MDDPTRRCENDTDKWKRATRGSCSQARAPLFCLPGLTIETHPILDNKWDGQVGRPGLPQSGISASGTWAMPFDLSEFHGESPALIHLLGRRNVQLMQYVDYFGVPQSRGVILKR